MDAIPEAISAGESLAAHGDRTVFIVFIVVMLAIGAGGMTIMLRYFIGTIKAMAGEAKEEREACVQERNEASGKLEELHTQRQEENAAFVSCVTSNTEILKRVSDQLVRLKPER